MGKLSIQISAKALQTRWFVRAPIGLYRIGLGFIFGSRLLMLEHTGRRTGARRFVVLEVVDRPAPDEYVVASGFGTRAQWYQNVQADPRVRISTGRHCSVKADATLMADTEAVTSLARYAESHPQAWAKLRATIEDAVGHPVENLPMVRLRIA